MKSCYLLFIFLLTVQVAQTQSLTAIVEQVEREEQLLFKQEWTKGKKDSIKLYLLFKIATAPDTHYYKYWLGKTYATHFREQPRRDNQVDDTYFRKAKLLFEQVSISDTTLLKPHLAIAELYFDKISVLVNSLPMGMSKEVQKLYRNMMPAVNECVTQSLSYAQQAEQRDHSHIPTLLLLTDIYAQLNNFDEVKQLKRRILEIERKQQKYGPFPR